MTLMASKVRASPLYVRSDLGTYFVLGLHNALSYRLSDDGLDGSLEVEEDDSDERRDGDVGSYSGISAHEADDLARVEVGRTADGEARSLALLVEAESAGGTNLSWNANGADGKEKVKGRACSADRLAGDGSRTLAIA